MFDFGQRNPHNSVNALPIEVTLSLSSEFSKRTRDQPFCSRHFYPVGNADPYARQTFRPWMLSILRKLCGFCGYKLKNYSLGNSNRCCSRGRPPFKLQIGNMNFYS